MPDRCRDAAAVADRVAVVDTGVEMGVGAIVAELEITRAWLVDPAAEREGPGDGAGRGMSRCLSSA